MCALIIFVKWSFLHEVVQGRGHREHPLAHRQAGKNMIAEVRRRLHHAMRVARGADTSACAGEGHEVVVSAVVAPGPGKAVGKDAAFQLFAKDLADIGLEGVAPQLPSPVRCFGQYSTQQQQHARGLQRKKFMQVPINAYLRAHELKSCQAAQAYRTAHKGYTPRCLHF